MIVSVDKDYIYNFFGVNDFFTLEKILDNFAPSLLEYDFQDFCNSFEELMFFNKKDVENSFSQGIYTLILDYNQNLFLEVEDKVSDDSTSTLW